MRLISQSGYFDISYEHHDVIVKEPVHCETWNVSAFGDNSENEVVLGEYSTKEKALKVMEMIREKVTLINIADYSGIDSTIKTFGENGLTALEIYEKLSGYFYMPQDSEVEARESC